MKDNKGNSCGKCELVFSESGELSRFYFSHPILAQEQYSERSRWAFGKSGDGTFQWTVAVKALCLLMIRAKIGDPQFLEGEAGSLASSLDYAITKRPDWLRSFFGSDSKGNNLSDRMFLRDNSERKREGPVRIRLSRMIHPLQIVVRMCKQDVSSDKEKLKILEAKLAGTSNLLGAKLEWRDILKRAHFESITTSLSDLVSFNNISLINRISKLDNTSYVKRYFKGAIRKLANSLGANTGDTNARLGLLDYDLLRRLLAQKPFRVSCPISVPESLILLVYLRDVLSMPIVIDSDHPYAIPLARKIVDKDLGSLPEAVVLGFVPSLSYLEKGIFTEYRPSFALPRARHYLLSGSGSKTERSDILREILMICSEPSTTEFFGWTAIGDTATSKRRINFLHREPDELAFDYASENSDMPPAIAMSIFASINKAIFKKDIVEQGANLASDQHSILYLHKSVDEITKNLFLAALRDAWLSLRGDSALRENLVAQMIGNEKYSHYVARVSGAIYSSKFAEMA